MVNRMLAWLMGVIVGDGHVDRYFVEISDRFRVNLKVVEKAYRIQIYRKKDVEKYINKIGFGYPTKQRLLIQYRKTIHV